MIEKNKKWVPFIIPIETANLFITNLCKSSCSYCRVGDWVVNNEEKAHHMSIKDLDKVIDWIKISRVTNVQLTGGELMLHPDILEFVEKIVNRGINIDFILTNGLAPTELYKKSS